MKVESISRDMMHDWIQAENLWVKDGGTIGTLLSGDRISCCDEILAAVEDEKIVTVATIAPQGEMREGQPTIVAIYTHPDFRRQGFGRVVTEAVVRRCIERGFHNIRVDVMSAHEMRIINSLPEDLRKELDVHDFGNVMDLF